MPSRRQPTTIAARLVAASLICLIAACGRQATSPQPVSEPAPTPAPPPPVPAPPTAATETPAQIAARLDRGIDVSHHSGEVDWATVAAEGYSFAFAKATEGIDLKDPAFDEYWSNMQAAGITRGAYHFFVTEDDPEAQAKFFIDSVVLESGDLAPVVDIEVLGHDTSAGWADKFGVWLETVEQHYGVKPIIYTAPNFWDENFSDSFGDYPLWVAEYEVESPRLPSGWTTWHLWQSAGGAQVAGVEKNADLNRVNPAADLAVLIVP